MGEFQLWLIAALVGILIALVAYIWTENKGLQKERNAKLDEVIDSMRKEMQLMQKQLRVMKHNYKALHDHVKVLITKVYPEAKDFFENTYIQQDEDSE